MTWNVESNMLKEFARSNKISLPVHIHLTSADYGRSYHLMSGDTIVLLFLQAPSRKDWCLFDPHRNEVLKGRWDTITPNMLGTALSFLSAGADTGEFYENLIVTRQSTADVTPDLPESQRTALAAALINNGMFRIGGVWKSESATPIPSTISRAESWQS